MKRKFVTTLCVMLAVLMSCTFMFAGCNLFGGGAAEYIIQYTDDTGTHQLTVTYGMPYSIESIPYQYGYEFLGLYDAETGGTQYVSANGSSVSTYSEKQNKVLFPQFKAIDYTVILDYQGAEVTGDRSLTVPYNSTLPELPKNLMLEHYEFAGWYTEENGKGTQIADRYGLLPVVSVLNETNFDLSDANHRVYLYAGFGLKTYSVIFNFGEGLGSEQVKVPYNTPIGEVVPKTRNADGEAVLLWSTKASDDSAIFGGRVMAEMELYAVEWAPVIEFNVNGGNEVTPVVARAGATIALPTPTKSLAKFLYWETVDGYEADLTVMPTTSTMLKAVWQAKIEFNSNGGSEVNGISEAAGTAIKLPTPTRDGYIFAGWYTADKEQYTRTIMPSEGIALKAGWYIEREYSVTLVENNIDKKLVTNSNTLTASKRLKIDISSVLPDLNDDGVKIRYIIDFCWGNTYKYIKADAKIALYEGSDFSSNYELARKELSHGTDRDSYTKDSMSGTVTIHNNNLYLYYCGAGELKISLTGGYGDQVAFYDIVFTIQYPDTTKLYL